MLFRLICCFLSLRDDYLQRELERKYINLTLERFRAVFLEIKMQFYFNTLISDKDFFFLSSSNYKRKCFFNVVSHIQKIQSKQ